MPKRGAKNCHKSGWIYTYRSVVRSRLKVIASRWTVYRIFGEADKFYEVRTMPIGYKRNLDNVDSLDNEDNIFCSLNNSENLLRYTG